MLEPVAEPEPGPFVYTAAIHTTADLVSSLAGITCLARELGFTRHPQTCYAETGHCASWHVQHVEWPLSLTVDCHPLRQTVAIAVSGLMRSSPTTAFFRWKPACSVPAELVVGSLAGASF